MKDSQIILMAIVVALITGLMSGIIFNNVAYTDIARHCEQFQMISLKDGVYDCIKQD